MQSRVYGGQSAEVTTIINESALLARIQGDGWSVSIVSFFFTSYQWAEMGYLRPGEGAEPFLCTMALVIRHPLGRRCRSFSPLLVSRMVLAGGGFFYTPPSLKLTHSQEVLIKASYEVQSRRSLVERIIRTINK
jgi:hypothetical protein